MKDCITSVSRSRTSMRRSAYTRRSRPSILKRPSPGSRGLKWAGRRKCPALLRQVSLLLGDTISSS